jgi:hypothetical protein
MDTESSDQPETERATNPPGELAIVDDGRTPARRYQDATRTGPVIPRGQPICVPDLLDPSKTVFVSNLRGLDQRCSSRGYSLHCAPRHQGKTTNLKLMKAYFEHEPTLLAHLRDQYGYKPLPEKHPVIFLTLKFTVPAECDDGMGEVEHVVERELIKELKASALSLGVWV